MNPRTDEELAEQAQRGCDASLEELLRRHQAPVLHFLRHRGNRDDAEDLLQETFLCVVRYLHRYQSRWRFRTWLFTIARRVSINAGRRRRPVSGDNTLDEVEAATPNPAQLVAEQDSRHRLWDAAARVLSHEQSTALWLHYVEGLSLREVAHVLEKPWLAVKLQVFRSRKKLLPELRRLGYDPLHPGSSRAQGRTKPTLQGCMRSADVSTTPIE